jgi:hypothetical protein
MIPVLDKPHDTFTGQAFVEWLSRETLRMIAINHEERTPYIDVDLKNQANTEASTKRDYHGRYLFELLQNANDVITAAKNDKAWSKGSPYRVRIELTDSALIVANDGVPFLEKDVDSIYRWGESSKDPNKSVGHKGIGFKSVLEITESPQIFSQLVQFRFDRKTCYREVYKIVKRTDLKVPITRFVFPYKINQLKEDQNLVKTLLNEDQFATVIRLPLRVDSGKILERIHENIRPTLLLFLNGIDQIEVYVQGKLEMRLHKEVISEQNYLGRDVSLLENGTLASRWLLFDAPKQIIENKAIIDELEDQTWSRVEKVGYAIAFPLDEQGQLQVEAPETQKLFVYFPTELNTSLRYLIHGDFYIDSARKQVSDSRFYNLWLIQQIANFLSKIAVPEIVERYPQNERVVQILVPSYQVPGFVTSLQEAIFKQLRDCAFVPTLNERSEKPIGVMLSPPGAAKNATDFHHFFTPTVLSEVSKGRQFPLASVEGDEEVSDFLLKLGAKRLKFEEIFKLFDGRNIVEDPSSYPDLYNFLWNWYNELSFSNREEFTKALSNASCVITDKGTWIKPHEYLYHAKLRQETVVMPRAIRADLVYQAAYDPEGRSGPTHKLLDILRPRVRDYNAPDIIRSSIIPLFEGNRFKNLSVEERSEVYYFLFEYWRTRQGLGDPEIERIKGKVQVPARPVTNRRRDELKWTQMSRQKKRNLKSQNLLENLIKK